jgi:UDP-N-acetylglucosamine diphosphorylase/glucosamine-1-phosphate N-acetyltransferase
LCALKIAEATIHADLLRDRNIVLFEDLKSDVRLFPLNVLRPSWEIRSGMGCLREWIQEIADPRRVILHSRARLNANSARLAGSKETKLDPNRETLFINGRVLTIRATKESAQVNLSQTVVDEDGIPLLALRSGKQALEILKLPGTELANSLVQEVGETSTEIPGYAIRYARFSWDYMVQTPTLLQRQLEVGLSTGEMAGARALRENVIGGSIVGDGPVYVGSDTKIWPQVVFSTEDGPIWIGSSVEIEPHCFLKGPLCIGDFGRVKAGTTLYGGSSFGPHSRVAGEISHCVFQGYANKQHAGYLGNSFLGKWVNLGAETVGSNLRNDYENVKVKVGGKLVESGERFIGLIAGDHTKTGINTMFNTGTVVGIACNIYGSDFPTRYIRSFQWGGASGFRTVPLERTLESAQIAMSRRGQELSAEEAALLRVHYYEQTTAGETV